MTSFAIPPPASLPACQPDLLTSKTARPIIHGSDDDDASQLSSGSGFSIYTDDFEWLFVAHDTYNSLVRTSQSSSNSINNTSKSSQFSLFFFSSRCSFTSTLHHPSSPASALSPFPPPPPQIAALLSASPPSKGNPPSPLNLSISFSSSLNTSCKTCRTSSTKTNSIPCLTEGGTFSSISERQPAGTMSSE